VEINSKINREENSFFGRKFYTFFPPSGNILLEAHRKIIIKLVDIKKKVWLI
jgi:hypothetical protein